MNLFKFCRKYIYEYKFMFYIYVIINIVSSTIGLYIPIITGKFIDNLSNKKDIDLMIIHCTIFIFLNVISIVLGFISNYIYTKVQASAGYNLNVDVLNHLKKVSVLNFFNIDSTYLTQRINNDSNSIIIFCIDTFIQTFINTIILIYSFIFLININKKIAIVLLFLLILYIGTYILFKKPLYEKSFEFKEAQSNFFSKLNEQLTFIKFIKVHSIEVFFKDRLFSNFKCFLHKALAYQKTFYLFTSCDNIIYSISQIFIYLLAGFEIINGNLTIGMFTIIISYFSKILSSSRYFFNLGKNYQENLVAYNRIQELFKIQIQSNGKIKIDEINCIDFENVSFNFENKLIFNNLNLHFEKGKIHTIVGDNGTGKTTLINLLLGLYMDNYNGNILYNNIDIKNLDMNDIRKHNISITEQEPSLISDTLLVNMTLSEKYSEEDLKKYFNLFGLDIYINSLEKGLNTYINEKNENISGGEKQKISLLRECLKESDVMIFDEPTSALDIHTKSEFFKYLDYIKENKIIILISHDSDISDFSDFIIKL